MRFNSSEKLKKDFFLRDTSLIAKELIGKIFVRKIGNEILSGKIVETEAYLPVDDFASHSAVGKTQRNAQMFEEGGTLYVYKIYGVHHCVNFVTEAKGKGAAVLIRAIEPLEGINFMENNREINKLEQLCKGPGNVAKAFGFSLNDNGLKLYSDSLFVLNPNISDSYEIISTKRIGISKSAALKLRFILKNSKFVSGTKKQNSNFK